jgi:hypothetical protein
MNDRPISRRTLNNLNSYHMSLLSAIGHLWGIEDTTASPCTRPLVSHTTTSTHNTQACKDCHAIGHHYTECHNHQYMWDSSANAHLLQPGKRLAHPADRQDIYRASLHHIIRTAVQYYTRIQDIHTLLTELELNSQFRYISQLLCQLRFHRCTCFYWRYCLPFCPWTQTRSQPSLWPIFDQSGCSCCNDMPSSWPTEQNHRLVHSFHCFTSLAS